MMNNINHLAIAVATVPRSDAVSEEFDVARSFRIGPDIDDAHIIPRSRRRRANQIADEADPPVIRCCITVLREPRRSSETTFDCVHCIPMGDRHDRALRIYDGWTAKQ